MKRALARQGEDFVHILIRDSKEEVIKNIKGDIFPVLVSKPDFDRLRYCFLHIAYGLYYHKFDKAFKGECQILMDFLTYDNEEFEKYKLLCRKRFEMEPNKSKAEGANPQIFRYEFLEPDEFGLIALRITFYEGTNVFIAFQGVNAKKPFNLVTELINSGIKTIVSFKDGHEFEFN